MSIWQRNYYEHIIRNEKSLNAIREYILNNPARWSDDPENPETFWWFRAELYRDMLTKRRPANAKGRPPVAPYKDIKIRKHRTAWDYCVNRSDGGSGRFETCPKKALTEAERSTTAVPHQGQQ
jgi:hypothetical protein